MFPVLGVDGRAYSGLGAPSSVPWRLLAPHEAQALRNHEQTLERLAARGGLAPYEMRLIVEGRAWRGEKAPPPAEEVAWLCLWLEGDERNLSPVLVPPQPKDSP